VLTLFTWGYWGWGNATREFVQAVDSAERARGFKPPIFFDIRFSRSVRAEGFRGDAFERLLPNGRYQWFRRLGNTHIGTREPGAKIMDPFAAKILLEHAFKYARDNRRVIVFCACEFPRFCHRHIVANLLLDEAARSGRRIQVVEWPGEAPIRRTLRVKEPTFAAVSRGLVNVPLGKSGIVREIVSLPWGSIVDVESGEDGFPIVTGPAKYQNGWLLPIWERGERESDTATLRPVSEKFRKRNGLQALETKGVAKQLDALKALTIRQPWAHAIVHLGKDVENRSWRANYKGPLLIHASAYRENGPRTMLAEYMSTPPSEKSLSELPTGSIIGIADLYDYIDDSDSRWADRGAWHWLLRNVRPIRSVECTGRLGLWTPSAAVRKKLPAWVRNLNHK
jgi:hypothetical protein